MQVSLTGHRSPRVCTPPKNAESSPQQHDWALRRSFTSFTERNVDWGSPAKAPGVRVGYRRLNSLGAGIISLEEVMLGCVQLVLGCVEQCCLFAMGCNLEPPPPLQRKCTARQRPPRRPRPTTSTRRWRRGRGRPRWQGTDAARRTTAAACIHANSAWTPGINAMDTVWEQAVPAISGSRGAAPLAVAPARPEA
jgi:hypothetical protein